MPLQIPDTIQTAFEARAALRDYIEFVKPKGPHAWELPDRSWNLRQPFNAAEKVLDSLDTHHGPGPVVRVQPSTGKPYLALGRDRVPADRTVLDVWLPVLDEYGDISGKPAHEWSDTFAEIATGAGVVQALGVRALVVAEVLAERGGKSRQVNDLQVEAVQLERFSNQLEALVPVLAPAFLDQWRADAARRGGVTEPPKPSPIHPVRLR